MSNLTKFVMALIGLVAMVIVVSRQLFLVTVFRNPLIFLDSQAGRSHLWLALGAGIAASISGILMFRFFSSYEKNKWPKVVITTTGPRLPGSGMTSSAGKSSYDHYKLRAIQKDL